MRIGSSIRRLRRQRSINQGNLAKNLGISASYLNLIENNKRNVTGDLLVKLAEVFNADLSSFTREDDPQLSSSMIEILSDSIFEKLDLSTSDVNDLVVNQPGIARAIIALYDNYNSLKLDRKSLEISEQGEFDISTKISAEIVSDFIQQSRNYFSGLENITSLIVDELGLMSCRPEDYFNRICIYLEKKYRIRVSLMPPDITHSTVRLFDPVARTVALSDALPLESRTFLLAQQLGLVAANNEINTITDISNISTHETKMLLRNALANYFAAALIMPYEVFFQSAQSFRYDIEKLQHRFGVSMEQVFHRLTTLQKPGLSGIPFHMLRVDIAGNISKKISMSGISLPRYTGACARWNVYTAFTSPDVFNLQISEMPDGKRYFCIAKTIRKTGGGFGLPQTYYSIGLGCSLEEADKLIYTRNIDLSKKNSQIVPVGVSCRTCSRLDCRQRAFPPFDRKHKIDENFKGLSAYVSKGYKKNNKHA